jgi:serine/threonine-protein kinase
VSTPSLDRYADDFERLRALPPGEREAALAALPLGEDERATLRRLLEADTDADDPLARALGAGAARLAAPRDERLGPYRLIRELGAGGMGTVFLAERVDGGFHQRVAIKLLRGFPTADGLRRLRQERQILAGLDHPNIARLLDGGETAEGQPWLALEYVDGLGLLDYAARHAPRLHDRLTLFDAMLDAVGHAHQRLVVHRDLKPANVLVNAAGEVKLLDFGIARLVDLDTAARETSTRVFSAGYASPEQREGRAVTTASDLYSLGVLLRELVGGRADRQTRAPAPLPLDAELAGIVAKATDEDPARRYASAGEFRDDLDRYRDGRPVRAAPMTGAYRLRKFVGRHRVGVAASLLAALALGVFVWRLDRERERALGAEAVAQQARAASERDAARARAALGFLTDAFEAAAPENALSTTVSVRDLLDTARAKLDAQKLDPAVARSTQRLLGSLYNALGETDTAIELFGRGLDGAQAGDRAEALALAQDYDKYADLLGTNDRIEEARAALDAAAALRRKHAPDDLDERARDLISLGFLHHNAGEDAKAIPILKQVFERPAGAAPLPSPLAVHASQMLAALLSSNGDCEAALGVVESALSRADGLAPNAPDRLLLLREQAAAQRSCGRPEQAERILRAVIEQQREVTGGGGIAMLQLDNELALTLKDLGRFREAAEVLRRSTRVDNESKYNQAVLLANLAVALDDAGDYAQAFEMHARVRAALDGGQFDADSDIRRRAMRNEARTLAQTGQPERAIDMLADLRERALRIDGEASLEYAMVTWQLALAQRRAAHVEQAEALTSEAERLWAGLVPPTHSVFAHVHRQRAALALMQNRLDVADRELAAAIAIVEANAASPVELATVRSEQAEVRRLQGRKDEARALLASSLPAMRDAFLPTQIWLAAAERTAAQVGIP